MALAFAIQVLMMLRHGYLPYPFVIAMIPFAALTVAGVFDVFWNRSRAWAPRQLARLKAGGHARRRGGPPVRAIGDTALKGVAVAALVAFVLTVLTPWRYAIEDLWHHDRDAGKAAALTWLEGNTSKNDALVVDDAFWVDLVRAGHPRDKVIWFTKLDVDRDVVLPEKDPWRSIDYIVLDHQDALSVHLTDAWGASEDTLSKFPTLGKAIENSQIVAGFGAAGDRVVIRRVIAPPEPQGAS